MSSAKGKERMDFLTQARTFLERARAASSAEEKEAHLSAAIELAERALKSVEEQNG